MVEEGAEVKAAVYPRVTCGAVAWHLAVLRRVHACSLHCYNGKGADVPFWRKVYFKEQILRTEEETKTMDIFYSGKHEICAPNVGCFRPTNDQELTAMLYIDSIFPAGITFGWPFWSSKTNSRIDITLPSGFETVRNFNRLSAFWQSLIQSASGRSRALNVVSISRSMILRRYLCQFS